MRKTDTVIMGEEIDLIDLSAKIGTGYFVAGGRVESVPPDGVWYRARIRTPEIRKACYFAPFQRYAINPALDLWPEGYNQCHPLPVRELRNLKRGGMFLMIQRGDDDFLAVLPMASEQGMAWLRADDEGLLLEAGHWGVSREMAPFPLLAWARDSNPYAAAERVWRLARDCAGPKGAFRLRSEKQYPEIFEYLGWCTWEEFKSNIDAPRLSSAIRALSNGDVPVRWILVDDGHLEFRRVGLRQSTEEGAEPVPENLLLSFDPDPRKFPEGWQPVFAARDEARIRWMGVWINFNGYWGGVADPNRLPSDVQQALMRLGEGENGISRCMPRDEPWASQRFYEAWVQTLRNAGFEFLKVDNQAKNVTIYRGHVANAVRAASLNHRALERAAAAHMNGMINCMAHNTICAFHYENSAVTRCSEDYKKEDLWRAKHHLSNSFYNALWLGQTVWCDHDMFHASDRVAAEIMARSKAISGGPIYLSDPPDALPADRILPLCLSDGRILRALAPAVPLPESLFINTYEDERAFRVIAPLPHDCAAIALYNLTHPEKPVTGRVAEEDYRHAGAMMQDGRREWPLPEEGVLAYEIRTGRARALRAGPIELTLPQFDDAFFVLCPIRFGWAVIGNPQKILAPATIADLRVTKESVLVRLHEAGPLLVWRAAGAVADAESLGGGLWRLPSAERFIVRAWSSGISTA